MISAEEAAAVLLAGQSCHQCGSPLPPDGQPCGGCGRIPPVTGPELTAVLEDSPLAVAEVEARQAVAEGLVMLDQAIDRLHEADRIRHVAQLRVRRDQAQRAYTAFQAQRHRLHGPRTAARKAEERARAELEAAQAEHAEIARAEETARRYRHGMTAETEAALRLAEAGKVLRRYQDAHDQAAARLRAAEAAVEQADGRAEQLEAARNEAAGALAAPGRIPHGAQTITLGLMRLLLGGQLTEPEQLIAGHIARQAVSLTGVMDDIEAEVRQQAKAEEEAERTSKPLILPRLQDGQVVAAPAPWNRDAPQMFHAPAPGNQAHPYQPAPPGGGGFLG